MVTGGCGDPERRSGFNRSDVDTAKSKDDFSGKKHFNRGDSSYSVNYVKGQERFKELNIEEVLRITEAWDIEKKSREVIYYTMTPEGAKENVALEIKDSSVIVSPVHIWAMDTSYIYLKVQADNFDSIAFLRSYSSCPSFDEIMRSTREGVDKVFVDRKFKFRNRVEDTDSVFVFLIFFHLEGEDGKGFYPYYLDSNFVKWYLTMDLEKPLGI